MLGSLDFIIVSHKTRYFPYLIYKYRGANKGLHVLLNRTQAGPGRTVKQEQDEISRNHVQAFILGSVHICAWARFSLKFHSYNVNARVKS